MQRVTESSGNVFADLGLTDPETELLRAELTFQICKRIKLLHLAETAVAARLGLSQPDASRLMKGRPTDLSTDRLLALLNALDMDVDIIVRPTKDNSRPGKLRVLAADA